MLDDIERPLEIIKIEVSELQLDEELRKAVNHIYDLSNEYPIRVCLFRPLNDQNENTNDAHNLCISNHYYLSIVIHHIAFDGWSREIFFKELEHYYNYYLAKENGFTTNLGLPELEIQYRDFALWQRSYFRCDAAFHGRWRHDIHCHL